jgi:hypothetical protein
MTESEKIEFLAGQVKAISHFLVVLISTHPDRASLKLH